jgi:outer membrane biosynthesis protein TonB
MELIELILSALFTRPRARTLAVTAICLALLATACERKTVKAVPPVLVPSIESEPQPAPPTPAATPAPASPVAVTPLEPEVEKPRHKPHKTIVRRPEHRPEARPEPPKQEAAKPQPPKPAAPDSSVQITAAVPQAAVQSKTENTEQLLRESERKLAGLNRALSQSEQAMATQARNYIAQSHQAIQEGDIDRAYNLAVKASLLADELSK